MRVHISEATKKCLEKTEFRTEFRGVVELKVTKIIVTKGWFSLAHKHSDHSFFLHSFVFSQPRLQTPTRPSVVVNLSS